jgi:hypothetical protein
VLFALHASDSKFCKDGLRMVKWPKRVAKIKITLNILCCLAEATDSILLSFNTVPAVFLHITATHRVSNYFPRNVSTPVVHLASQRP